MTIGNRICSLMLLIGAVHVSGCTPSAQSPVATAIAQAPTASSQELPVALVHKSPACGCCALWVDHLKQAGFQVEVRDTEDMTRVKQRLGVPDGKGSCHTAEIGGYFVEGHVPAEDIKRLLAEQPDAKGLVVPGMPLGSPGMKAPVGSTQRYTVELVGRDGSTHPYAQH